MFSGPGDGKETRVNISLIDVGYGSYVSAERVIAVISPDSAPVKRMVQEAKEERRLIDATFGKKTRAVIITDSDHIVLASIETEDVMHRFCMQGGSEPGEDAHDR